MRTYHSASERSPKGGWYWFLDGAGRPSMYWAVRKCRETGHRFDAEHFETGNYFLTHAHARAALDLLIEVERIRRERIRKLLKPKQRT